MAVTSAPSGKAIAFEGRGSSWFVAGGMIFVALGLTAMVEPAIAGLALTVLLGWLLIACGVTEIVQSLAGRGSRRVIWALALGAVYIVGGLYFLTHPLLALSTLTLCLAGILLADGVVRIAAYIRMRGNVGAGWALINGIVTLLLALIIWQGWPSSSAWAIGMLVGLNLMMSGFFRLMLIVTGRTLSHLL